MANFVNRISGFDDPAPYKPVQSNELEQKLKLFLRKYIVVVYTHYNNAGSEQRMKGGKLLEIVCKKEDDGSNKVEIHFLEQKPLILIDGDNNNIASKIDGVINWVGTNETHQRLTISGYFPKYRAE